MLIQLIYMSAATSKFAEQDLHSILSKSRLNNKSLNISGMLLYHEGVFLQILEGQSGAIDKLYQRIATDERHCNCEVLARCTMDQRSFGDWSMGFANIEEVPDPELIPGYRDFFKSEDPLAHLRQKSGLAQKLLLAFRDANCNKRQQKTLSQ